MKKRSSSLVLFATLVVLTLSACPRSEVRRGAPLVSRADAGRKPRPDAKVRAIPLKVVSSLLDHRLLAHFSVAGGLFVPGDHGLAKYLDHGRLAGQWRLGPKQATAGVAPVGHLSELVLPLTDLEARATTLTMKLRLPLATTVQLQLNGRKLPPLRLDKGWQTPHVTLPPGLLKAGENRLKIEWGNEQRERALAWLHLGLQPSPTADDELPRVVGGVLQLPAGAGVGWFAYPSTRARLRLAARQAAGKGGACQLKVTLQDATRAQTEVLATTKKTELTDFDLATRAGRVVRIQLTALGEHCAGITLQQVALAEPARRSTVALPSTAASRPSVASRKRPQNVLLWVVDTARADHYPRYNPRSRVQTPRFDRLAASGVLFEHAYSAGPESITGYGALWTGAHPRQNGQLGFAWRRALPKPWTTLPEALSAAKRATGCFSANGFASAQVGYAAGCDEYHNAIHEGGGKSAGALVDRALAFVKKQRGKPFFLYLGTIDPHVSLRAREPWISRYHAEPYSGPFEKGLPGLVAARFKEAVYERHATPFKHLVSPKDRKRIIAIYDSTISYNDQQLGRLLDQLKALGVAKDTLVVITADHGEELWDEGGFGHSHSLKDFVTRVPLLMHYPPRLRAGVRVPQAVGSVDVMPTILETLGLPIPDNVQGQPLGRLIADPDGGQPRAAIVTRYGKDWALRLARFKLIALRDTPAKLYEFVDGQERPCGDALARRWLTDVLGTFLVYQARWRSLRWGDPANHRAALAVDLERGSAPARLGHF